MCVLNGFGSAEATDVYEKLWNRVQVLTNLLKRTSHERVIQDKLYSSRCTRRKT